jgi:uncharacterized protein
MKHFIVDDKHEVLLQSPYNLAKQRNGDEDFYGCLARFALQVETEGQQHFAYIIQAFQASQLYRASEFVLAPNECLLDLLITGVLWDEYKGRWGTNIATKAKILNTLYALRKSYPQLKPIADRVRGNLSYRFLHKETVDNTGISIENLKKLCTWLSAANEFNEEVKRIEIWISFLATLPHEQVNKFLRQVLVFSSWFKTEAKKELGIFTQGVAPFLVKHAENYKGNEDFFFTGRSETEYHLNMVGAAIMNQSMKTAFLAAKYKVLLLPSCMAKNSKCLAYQTPQGHQCAHCTKGCSISGASLTMEENGGHAFLVYHSSGFSKSLKQWANQSDVGLIGTACTLNLLTGGYEMKRLNIPAQCIFLNYSGCKKHWPSVNSPTTINLQQLKALMQE